MLWCMSAASELRCACCQPVCMPGPACSILRFSELSVMAGAGVDRADVRLNADGDVLTIAGVPACCIA